MDMSPIAAGAFSALLERATGQQLAPGRRWRIETALGPILRARGIDTLDHLAALLRGADRSLRGEVVEALLNHETFFFRDIGAFRMLAGEALPALATLRGQERRLRLWSAGCSTGQEAYSLAIALGRDGQRWADWDISILGTDISHQAVARARDGLYGPFEIQRGLPIGDMIDHFQPEGDGWRVSPALRARIAFQPHNLFDIPPPGRFDLVLCRNVLLYFSPERRRAVLDRLAEAMAPDAMLLLGAGETLLGHSDAFDADPALRGVYRPRAKGAR